MNKYIKQLITITIFSFSSLGFTHDLGSALSSEERTPNDVLRDEHRNPFETLSFFGIESNMKVVELSPGAGWYTEILANYLHDPGILIAAHFDKNSERAYFKRSRANFEKKVVEKSMYDNVYIVNLSSS